MEKPFSILVRAFVGPLTQTIAKRQDHPFREKDRGGIVV
jgi:hypothetical protein